MDIKARVWSLISWRVGRDKAIDRWELAEQVFERRIPEFLRTEDNREDRAVRDAISQLRKDEKLICIENGLGFFIASTEAEFWQFYQAYTAPIRDRWETAEAMKKGAAREFPNLLQPRLI